MSQLSEKKSTWDVPYWSISNWDKKLELAHLGKTIIIISLSSLYLSLCSSLCSSLSPPSYPFNLFQSEVLKAKHLGNGKVVDLKKIFTKSEQEGFPITSLREIKLLKNVSHPNVASLIDMAVSYKSSSQNDLKDIEDIYMVFPFMDHDLTGLLENSSIKFNLPQIKCYMKQLLEGIAYLHTVRKVVCYSYTNIISEYLNVSLCTYIYISISLYIYISTSLHLRYLRYI